MSEDKLLTEIVEIVESVCKKDGPCYVWDNYDCCPYCQTDQILAKIREVIEGAGLTDEELATATNFGVDKFVEWQRVNPNEHDTTYEAMREQYISEAIAKAQLQAILKAIGGKDE